ncbi:Butyryl-CoA dehydrogenase [Syntrophobotulus glycolicus DSM 8271]|uniref:Butyryl-CoA dehydrogenase n=1 Tax=Syntrophobotulus glycolicus (strain DSM 8271 / FlGlyR) TaxID=645991 RepID=F0SU74_SYNGF|nr:acyl-CoA dehydrogenase family protein [Syntrophobotulus glycolicus]ADY55457.1 Butyryl-CoA dehydrogenase [Syntrophobotulus glycolicus DSM 8271]
MLELKRYLLNEDQQGIKDLINDFAVKEIMPAAEKADITGEFPLETVKKAANLGFTLLTLPEEYGGLACNYSTIAVAKEELGHADVGFAATLSGAMLGTMPVKLAGGEYHWKKVADVLTGGGLTAFALTEPSAGSDAGACRTTAVRSGDDYILNGRKCFCTNAAYADIFTVIASTDRSQGAKGLTAFLVDAGTPGLTIGKEENKMGARSSNTCDVVFEDVKVPAKNRIGEEGKGFIIAMKALGIGRASAGATAIGNARFALEYALDYATKRVTFGKPIAEQQGIQHLLADMYMRLEAARSLTAYACQLVDNGIVDAAVNSSAKAFGSDTGMSVTTDAVQILGGYGYSKEYPLEKRMRDAKIMQIWEGTNQIQRNLIAGNLIARAK